MKLNVQWFIEQHSDWENILSQKPYCLHIVKDRVFDRNLILLKYDQIESDMGLPIVQECRGLILDADTNEIVSFPFKKFFNFGEKYAAEIDWKSCWVGEKIDGSITKVVKLGNKLLWSTNGVPNAFNAPLADQIGCTAKSFGDLMMVALDNAYTEYQDKCAERGIVVPDIMMTAEDWFKSLLKEGYTYIFELTSPFSKVVVQFHETKLNFLGCRNNSTFDETYFTDHPLKEYFNTPKVFPLTSIEECQKATESMGPDQEGFVVCDKNFNRIKIKSVLYVSLAHMRNNGVLSYARGIEIVRGNELDEVLTYFPEFKSHLEEIRDRYNKLRSDLYDAKTKMDVFIASNGWDRQPWWIESGGQKRKDIAVWIMKNFPISGLGFALIDKKADSVDSWLMSVPAEKMVQTLGFKQKE